MQPFYTQSRGQALRSFSDTANDQASAIGRHAADFTLFQIGEFDDADASFIDTLKVNLGCAIEFKETESPLPFKE